VRTLLGVTAGEFRFKYDEQIMLDRILNELVRPHRTKLEAIRAVTMRRPRRASAGSQGDALATPPSLAARSPAFMRRVP
jgi:hypothetical protein